MGTHLNELGHIEQELTELQSQLKASFGVLDGLAQIPSKFEELGQTYQQLREYVETTQTHQETINHIEKRFEQRCVELETLMESRVSEIRSELASLRDLLDREDGNLEQIDLLKHEFEDRMKSIMQEWTGSNDEIPAPLKDLDARLNHLDTRTHMGRKYMQQLERQVKTLQGGMVFAVVAAIASVVMAILSWNGSPVGNASNSEGGSQYDVNGQPKE
jgi:chromosome segregation ATPase